MLVEQISLKWYPKFDVKILLLDLVVDCGTNFLNTTIKQLMTKYLIKHKKTTPYHPQINGQSEKTKGLLCGINLDKNHNGVGFDWDTNLFGVLVAYQIAYKVMTSHTPFQFVYGQEVILTIKLELPSL
jgi:hypothetical protein